MKFRLIAAVIAISLISGTRILADGIPMTRDFHFTSGKRCTIQLIHGQIEQLESQRKNSDRLFAAKVDLTEDQSLVIQKMAGVTVTQLYAFENQYGDCSCCARNVASRFSKDKLEVSSHYLTDTTKLKIQSRAVELMTSRNRQHWWQFWRRKIRTCPEAVARATREIDYVISQSR